MLLCAPRTVLSNIQHVTVLYVGCDAVIIRATNSTRPVHAHTMESPEEVGDEPGELTSNYAE